MTTTRGRRGLLRRAGWNLIDQVLSAATNAALSFLVARTVDARGFGAFAVGFLVFTLLIGVGRALVGQPLSIRYSGRDVVVGQSKPANDIKIEDGAELRDSTPAGTGEPAPAEELWDDGEQFRDGVAAGDGEPHCGSAALDGGELFAAAVARGMGAIVLVSVPAAVVCAVAGLVIGGVLRPTLLAFALVLPALVVQDGCRQAFFARARPELATLNDALWAVVQFAGVSVLIVTGRASAWSLALTWGGAAAVCAVLGLVQLRIRPRVWAGVGWIREHRDLVGYLVADYLLGAGALQGGILLIGALVGIGDLGSLRAAQVLTGPLGVLFSAAMAFGLPEVSRRRTLTATLRRRLAAAVSTLMFTASLAYTGVLLLIPNALGAALLGETWRGASAVVLPVALVSAFAGACLGPVIVILALGRSRDTFRLTVIEAVLVPTAMLIGARSGGAAGAAWGLCLQQAVLVPLWFRRLHLILAEPIAPQGKPRTRSPRAPGPSVARPSRNPPVIMHVRTPGPCERA